MKVVMSVLVVVMVLVLILSMAFGLEWLGIQWKGFFGPKHEDVRREVFKRTRSYNEGMEQQLVKLKLEYELAKDEQDRAALASAIRHTFSDYDESLLSSAELRSFLARIKYAGEFGTMKRSDR